MKTLVAAFGTSAVLELDKYGGTYVFSGKVPPLIVDLILRVES